MLTGFDCGSQCGDDLIQRQCGTALFRQIGNMDKADLRCAAVKMVQQGIQNVIAYESACRIGYSGWNLCTPDGLRHLLDRNSGKISGGAVGNHKFTLGLTALVIGDPGIPDIDSDALRCYGIPSAGLTDAKNHVGTEFFRSQQRLLCGKTEYGRDGQLA